MKAPKTVLLVGCGEMAVSYASVLRAFGADFSVIGRGEAACAKFSAQTGIIPLSGGVELAATKGLLQAQTAIVAVNVDQLAPVTDRLIASGVKRILLEKPGGLNQPEIIAIDQRATAHQAEVFVAYNRRFYASVRQARELIAADGGATSLFFEFTEWSHLIAPLPTAAAVKSEWFLANSSHVCDLAFFLGGFPVSLAAECRGALAWHPAGAQFAGCGITDTGAVFAYHSNWESAGRWGVEICTARRRLHLRPLETLHEQMRGELVLRPVPLEKQMDKDFKPGLHAQTRAFLEGAGAASGLLPLSEQVRHITEVYRRMVPIRPPQPHA